VLRGRRPQKTGRLPGTAPLTLLLLGVWIGLAGCGRKTPPLPPETIVPAPITDLAVTLHAGGATLSWSFPRRTVTGQRLSAITAFEIFRAAQPAADGCTGCPIPFEPPRIIAGGPLPARHLPRQAVFDDAGLRPGYRYFYKVRARMGTLAASSDSNIVSFVWQTPPAAPRGLTAKATDGAVYLRWQPPATLLDNTPVTGSLLYQVERGRGTDFRPLGPPVAVTSFTDHRVQNGTTYHYQVRAVRPTDDGLVITGLAAGPVSATPRAQAPSPPPPPPPVPTP